MKKDYLLKPLLAMFMLMALAIPVQAIELTENFNSTRTDGGAAFDRYGTTTSFGTAGMIIQTGQSREQSIQVRIL